MALSLSDAVCVGHDDVSDFDQKEIAPVLKPRGFAQVRVKCAGSPSCAKPRRLRYGV